MLPLQDSDIESPEKIFEVDLVLFGTFTRSAVRRRIRVLAQTPSGAKRICKSRYRRSEIKSARENPASAACLSLNLFPFGEY